MSGIWNHLLGFRVCQWNCESRNNYNVPGAFLLCYLSHPPPIFMQNQHQCPLEDAPSTTSTVSSNELLSLFLQPLSPSVHSNWPKWAHAQVSPTPWTDSFPLPGYDCLLQWACETVTVIQNILVVFMCQTSYFLRILTRILWCRYCYYLHFSEVESEIQMVRHLAQGPISRKLQSWDSFCIS